jgi:hypothetical protein
MDHAPLDDHACQRRVPRTWSRRDAALSLALDIVDPIVVLDDAAARTAAATLNIPSTGTLGVLLLAKERGLVTSMASVITQLEQRGFRIAPAVIARVLAIAGE